MNSNQDKIDSVLALSGPRRYDHFIKVVAEREELWALYNDGWVLAGTDDDDRAVCPIWPEKVYAELCIGKGSDDNQAKALNLFEFMEEIMPELHEDGILPCVFFLPSDKGVIPKMEQLLEDLKAELQRI
ncbi:MAG: DUF2750 domain-containing protein [Candidatus Melainabacteria bacterium]|nr:MAG: DUF2750 domain-containing protein [Candidatus Melainabacteria bacterium]